MAEQCFFNVGKDFILQNGLVGASASLALSAKTAPVNPASPQAGEFSAADVYAGLDEIIGWTGDAAYARLAATVPSSTNGVITLSPVSWNTGSAIDGPSSVKTAVLLVGTTPIFAQNLQTGGADVPLDRANTRLTVTLQFFLQNVGGT